MRELPTGTVTLLFTDMEGSTCLLQLLGKRYSDVLAECRALMRAAFHQHHGQEVDTQGDAFFVAFASATDGLSLFNVSSPAIPGLRASRYVCAWACILVSRNVPARGMWDWTCTGRHVS